MSWKEYVIRVVVVNYATSTTLVVLVCEMIYSQTLKCSIFLVVHNNFYDNLFFS